MTLKILLPAALVSSLFLLNGCESEAVAKLNEACGKDMKEKNNEEACEIALSINCGGRLGVGAVKDCVKHPEEGGCVAIPSYCLENYSKAFPKE